MSKINFAKEENQIPRWRKIVDHAQACVNLFNNEPYKIKKDFRHPFFYIIFEALDKRGIVRTLSYNCFSESEQESVAIKLYEHFGVDIEEVTE
ncbi:MAG: hypothetical protein XE08_0367 [Parcubacteria bacterium 32_520]|nr:MAG: hypothetical protein XE08_0367 [Parcubacteria bacterium 32_520]